MTAQKEVKPLLVEEQKQSEGKLPLTEQKQNAANGKSGNGQMTPLPVVLASPKSVSLEFHMLRILAFTDTNAINANSILQINPPKTSSHGDSTYSIGFHPKLKYVAFPDLDEFRAQCSATELESLAGKEVKYVLGWLRLIKGVKEIIEVRVLDSRNHPHSEEIIEDAIQYLKVEELDWKRVDLSITAVRKASEHVKKLHLYSSGCWTPLCHWMGPDGLNALKVSVELRNSKFIRLTVVA